MRELRLEGINQALSPVVSSPTEVWFFFGAGLSVPEFPDARGLADELHQKYPDILCNGEKTYQEVMQSLPKAHRAELIQSHNLRAKVRLHYIVLAHLLQTGVISRCLTVNFDTLFLQACGMIGFVPGVYDLATILKQKPTDGWTISDLPSQSVYFLHGQATGFVHINGKEEADSMTEKLREFLGDVRKRLWIVAGFSGENDPVTNLLADANEFDAGLYWVRHDDSDPCLAVKEKVLNKKGAYIIRNCTTLQLLESISIFNCLWPPRIFQNPFQHILQSFSDRLSQEDVSSTRSLLVSLESFAREQHSEAVLNIRKLVELGHYKDAIDGYLELAPHEQAQCQDSYARAIDQNLNELTRVGDWSGIARQLLMLHDKGIRALDEVQGRAIQLFNVASRRSPKITFEALASSETRIALGLDRIEFLDLWGSNVTDEDVSALEYCPKLTRLVLGKTRITSRGIANLARCNELSLVYASQTEIDDTSVEHFLNMKSLAELYAWDTGLSEGGVATLRRLRPNLRVFWSPRMK